MTDYDPYVAEPHEPAPTRPRPRLRAAIGWVAVLVIVLAVVAVWLRSTGQEDPSLQVPQERLSAPADPPAEGEQPQPEPAPQEPAPEEPGA